MGTKVKGLCCPACHQETVEAKHLEGGHWLLCCYNGECDELPEVSARTKAFAIRLLGNLTQRKAMP